MAIPFPHSLRALEADGFRSRHWLVAGLVLLAAWLGWFFGARIGVYESSRRARVESSLAAHPVQAPVAGRIAATRLQVGRRVAAGELLVEVETAAERTLLDEARAELHKLSVQLEEVRAEVSAAEAMFPEIREAQRLELDELEARIVEASAEYERLEKRLERLASLRAPGLVSAQEVDEAEAGARAGAARIDQLRAVRARRQKEQGVEIREHENRLRESRRTAVEIEGQLAAVAARSERHRRRVDEHTIRAPVAGRLGEVAALEAGSVLALGDAICSIVPDESAQRIVAGFPPHRALGRVREGQSARVRLESFPWPEYGLLSARVESIGSESALDRDGLVRVELSLFPLEKGTAHADPSGDANRALVLEHGLPGEARVLVERVSPAQLLLRTLGRAAAPARTTEQPRTARSAMNGEARS
jgi:membrane fusion protein (multidrug efflux system)